MSTRTIRHDAAVNGCGGAYVGDWDTVACDRCGLRHNTLDVGYAGIVERDEVLRLSPVGTLIAVTVA